MNDAACIIGRMMIIDFHTHTFPEKIAENTLKILRSKSHTRSFSDGTVRGLLEGNGMAGIDLSVVLPVATAPAQVEHINTRAAEQNTIWFQNEERPCGVLSFACMHPEHENPAAELKRIKNLGFRGIKIHPAYQNHDIDDLPFLRILDQCAELGLPAVTHAGWDIGFPGVECCLPQKIRRAVRTVDPEGRTLRLVAAHMGGWRCWEEVPELLADTGVYLDTSFSTGRLHPLEGEEYDGYYEGKEISMLNPDGFMELYSAFGAERLLFGTDSPWSSREESLGFLRRLPVPDRELALILGGNASRLLCL